MKLEIEIHPAQAEILKTLLFNKSARFTELNTTKIGSDHFTFHLKRLLELGLLEKMADDRYELTNTGKEFANRLDTDVNQIERQAKVAVRMIGVRFLEDKKEYLIQQRLKQPFFGFYGTIGGKVKWGETLFEAGERELLEETGLTGKLTFIGIQHKLDYSKGDLLEDKFFFLLRCEDLKGELLENFEGGKNLWITKEEIFKLPDVFPNMPEVIKMIDADEISFFEKRYEVEKY
jgi:ADP-ribose pyrophosphatase YjhB (NUDIX family)